MSHKEVMRSAIGAFHEKDTTCEIMFCLEALDAKFGIYANFSSAPLPSAHTFSRELRFLGPWIHVGVRVRGWCACVCVCVYVSVRVYMRIPPPYPTPCRDGNLLVCISLRNELSIELALGPGTHVPRTWVRIWATHRT